MRYQAASRSDRADRSSLLPHVLLSDTVFECLFCQNSNSVSVKMDQKESIGLLRCKTCLQKFSCHITRAYSWPSRANFARLGTGDSACCCFRGGELTLPRPRVPRRRSPCLLLADDSSLGSDRRLVRSAERLARLFKKLL